MMRYKKEFFHPEPKQRPAGVFAVFIPFAGCPVRCVFCSQNLQTGSQTKPVPMVLEDAARAMEERKNAGLKALDLAFYGGTFTALSREDQERCMDFAAFWREKNLVKQVRCSTRPDCIDEERLSLLKERGMDLVELGIQSFSSLALEQAGRNYTGNVARKACELVKKYGFELGIQLMPGMPGVDLATAEADVRAAADFAPDYARLYPCLVLENTPLAGLWRAGSYKPWPLAQTVVFLAQSMLVLWKHGVQILRTGLAPEKGLAEAVLDGPMHEALGSKVRGLALLLHMKDILNGIHFAKAGMGSLRLYAPIKYNGEFWGHGKELATAYEDMGIGRKNVKWWDHEFFRIETADAVDPLP